MRVASTRRGDSLQCDCFVLQILFAAGLRLQFSPRNRLTFRDLTSQISSTHTFGGVGGGARGRAQPWPTTPRRKLVQTYRQLRARSARSWRHSIRRPYSGRISFGLLCTRSRRVASSAISNCCRSGTFVRATLFQSLCTICSCPPLPLTHHQCVFCMQRALQP